YRQWDMGRTNHLFLYLDSLDRTQLGKEQTIEAIINELRNADISRLTLRITCRDFDWSFNISQSLELLWQARANKKNKSKPQTKLTPAGDFANVETTNDPNADEASEPSDNAVQVYQLAPLTRSDI